MNYTVAGLDGLLTEREHEVCRLLALAYNEYLATGAKGPDLGEFATAVHHAQHAVMAQAAARAYPDLYRLTTGTKP